VTEAWCLNCLGVALRQMGRYEEALASHREAFALLDELFEEHWKIHFLNGCGETCRLAGLPEEALRLHRQTLGLAPKLGYRYEEAMAHEGIAAVPDETDPPAAAEHRAAGQAILRELKPDYRAHTVPPTAGTTTPPSVLGPFRAEDGGCRAGLSGRPAELDMDEPGD
jgi:tetratricopeptide (TPR) repeat protein